MTDRALNLLGLALRGGNLAVGEEPVAGACRAGTARLVLIAAGAAPNSADRAIRAAEKGGVPWANVPWDKETLGGALGRSLCAVAALTDQGLAGALAGQLAQRDETLRPIALALKEKKKSRAGKARRDVNL